MSDHDADLKQPGRLRTDEEAERFVDEADLTEYDLSGFRPVQFEYEGKSAQVNMRMPQRLLDAVRDQAKARGIPYQRYIRETLENALRDGGK
jgi:predicted DNA binding CopG/RHH family protein